MANNNPTYYDRKRLDAGTTVFKFDSMIEYTKFTNHVMSVAEGNARKGFDYLLEPDYIQRKINKYGSDWFGTTDLSQITKNVTSYLFNDRLEEYLNGLKSRTIDLDVIDIEQKKQIKFTEQEIGVFSFDLASLGLIPVYEFYSPVLDKIVSANVVAVEKDEKGVPILDSKGKMIFYHIYQPTIEKHFVAYSTDENGWYSKDLKMVIPKTSLLTENGIDFYVDYRKEVQKHIVDRKNKLNDKGEKQFVTTWKKCFVHMPKVEKTLPRVDIIINSSFSYTIKAEREMVYSSMSAICIAQKLSSAGVDYRLIASYGTTTAGSRREDVIPFVTLKKEGEPLDINAIAILLSDARQYRLNNFNSILAIQYDAGLNRYISPEKISYAMNDVQKIKRAYIQYLSESVNPEDVASSKNEGSKIVLESVFSEADAIRQYNNTIALISKTT